MAGQIVLSGIVLTSMPVGDYDRRLSILTMERGRVPCFASGARRPKSNLSAPSRQFTFGRFIAFEGKDSYRIVSCEEPKYFDELLKDPFNTYYGMYFCELLEYLTRENADEKEQVKLLYAALNALIKGIMPVKLIRRVFELRALGNYGEAPNIFECAFCQKKTDNNGWIFNYKSCVLICDSCRNGDKGGSDTVEISEAVRYTMHYCLISPYKRLFGFELKEDVYQKFDEVVGVYLKQHVDKPMKSLEVIEFADI